MQTNNRDLKVIYYWLITCCCMVFLMVLIGGLTRLSNSGLSMVEWKIFSGIFPPFNTNDWFELFDKYKQYPEYKLINQNLSLGEFKFIFWIEYFHRIWGRLIFLFFSIPLIIFLTKKYIPKKLEKHFFIIVTLILLQGFVGWYMVKSGLVDNPNVSHYRLAIHLIIAFIIYGYMLFLTLTINDLVYKKDETTQNKNFFILNSLLIFLILVTVFSGGMVAGLDAGLVYNTFPLMGETFIPNELFNLNPIYLNFFENPVTVQFDHRFLGTTIFILVFTIWFYSRKIKLSKKIKIKINFLLFTVFFQTVLGIATLLSYVAMSIALTHQLGALIVYSVSIWTLKSLPFVSK